LALEARLQAFKSSPRAAVLLGFYLTIGAKVIDYYWCESNNPFLI